MMDKNIEERIIEKLSDMCGDEYEGLRDLGDGRFELRSSDEEEDMESIASDVWMDVMERLGTETMWAPFSDVAEFIYDRITVVPA